MDFGAFGPIDPRTVTAASVAVTPAGGARVYDPMVDQPKAPSVGLGRLTEHTVTLDGAAIRNLWGMDLKKASAGFTLKFTTASCG